MKINLGHIDDRDDNPTLFRKLRAAFHAIEFAFSKLTDTIIVEDAWTPVLQGDSTAGTQTYDVQTGWYVIFLNRLVYVTGRIRMTAKDGATAGNISIGGLPRTVMNRTNSLQSMSIAHSSINLSAGYSQAGALLSPNTTKAYLYEMGDNVAMAPVVAAGIGATTEIVLSGFYLGERS